MRLNTITKNALWVIGLLAAGAAAAQTAPGGSSLPLLIGQGSGGTNYSVPIQTLLFFTALSFFACHVVDDDGLHPYCHCAQFDAPGDRCTSRSP
jgi:hypothetical protein